MQSSKNNQNSGQYHLGIADTWKAVGDPGNVQESTGNKKRNPRKKSSSDDSSSEKSQDSNTTVGEVERL